MLFLRFGVLAPIGRFFVVLLFGRSRSVLRRRGVRLANGRLADVADTPQLGLALALFESFFVFVRSFFELLLVGDNAVDDQRGKRANQKHSHKVGPHDGRKQYKQIDERKLYLLAAYYQIRHRLFGRF